MKSIRKLKLTQLKKWLFLILMPALLVSAGIAQDQSWLSWSKTDAEKILNHSAWGQTQTETDTSEMVYSPTNRGTSSVGRSDASRGRTGDQQSINNDRADRGATNQAISVNYHVRLLSAKPVRQAFMRVISLTEKNPDAELLQGLESFVQRDFKDYIVVAVALDSIDARFSAPAQQSFVTARIGTLKNASYLERKDGKRVFLMDYHPPISDGLGAKFIFPRRVDERLFLSADSGSVRFYCELTPQIRLNVTFKLSDMMYEGKLEY
jgi:hypothetical protein